MHKVMVLQLFSYDFNNEHDVGLINLVVCSIPEDFY